MSKKKVCSHDAKNARVVLCVRVPRELIQQIDDVAVKSDRTRSQIALWAIKSGIDDAQDNAGVVA
jgi:predicted transcriptional regulator